MIRIRLRRIGKKKKPSYRVVVADKMAPRDGAFLETLGSYDPHAEPPDLKINAERTKEWIDKGAMPSEAAEKILVRAGVLEKKEKFVPHRKLAVKPKPAPEDQAPEPAPEPAAPADEPVSETGPAGDVTPTEAPEDKEE